MKIISIANQKGGVGKTTTSVNLAASIAYLGISTLLIDIDWQANATSGLGIDKNNIPMTIYDTLINKENIQNVILETSLDWLDIIPSCNKLLGAEIKMQNKEYKEYILKNALEKIKNNYEYIFIDCPPYFNMLTLNSLVASTGVIIPIQCEYYALEGFADLLDNINKIKDNLNNELIIEGLLMTMYDSRINLSKQIIENVKKFFPDKIYKTIIPRNIKLAESPSFGKPTLLYDIKSNGAIAYLELAKEITNYNKYY